MNMDKYFLVQIKRTNDIIEKGVVVKDTLQAAKQGYHSYLGAYAYGNNSSTDYVATYIVDSKGVRLMWEIWEKFIPDVTPDVTPDDNTEGEG